MSKLKQMTRHASAHARSARLRDVCSTFQRQERDGDDSAQRMPLSLLVNQYFKTTCEGPYSHKSVDQADRVQILTK